MSAAERFAADLRACLAAAGAPEGPVWYRRAVPSERRAGLTPPPLPHPLLVITGPRGFACVRADALVADEESIDAALHAARAAGTVEDTVAHIKWCVASAPCGRTAALLRACGFVPLPGAADTTPDPYKL